MNSNEVEIFRDGDLSLKVTVSLKGETVWLTLDQIAELFEKDRSVISRHVLNIFNEGELQEDTSVQIMHGSAIESHRPPKYYNLDVIISVGYRVKSKRGIAFRRWANSILKQYIMKGYTVNEKRLKALGKTIELQSRIIAGKVVCVWCRKGDWQSRRHHSCCISECVRRRCLSIS